jgi:hypothetical protein
MLTTNALAETKSLDLPIERGTPAFFTGVLVPEDHYRKYSEGMEMLDYYNANAVARQSCEANIKSPNWGWIVGMFSLGMLTGMVILR